MCYSFTISLLTSINQKDCSTSKGGQVKASFLLSEVSTHHRTKYKADTGSCIKVSHHQGALRL